MMASESTHRIRLSPLLGRSEACHFAEATLDAARSVPVHGHDFVEIFWVVRGQGEERRKRRARPLAAGDVTFVRARDVHALRAADYDTMTIRNLAFAGEAWSRLRDRYAGALADRFAATAAGRRLRVPHLLGAIEDASAELRSGGRSRLALDRFLLRLDGLLAAAGTDRPPAPAWLAEAVRALGDDARLDLSDGPPALVERCGRSAEHVARSCRLHLGRTPTQLVDEARCRRAARLLAETDRPVLQVCYDSGFNNVGHFHARFRRWFGETPRRHRARALGTVLAARPVP